MSGHCPGCGVYHEEDDSRPCPDCAKKPADPYSVGQLDDGTLMILAEGVDDALIEVPFAGENFADTQLETADRVVLLLNLFHGVPFPAAAIERWKAIEASLARYVESFSASGDFNTHTAEMGTRDLRRTAKAALALPGGAA